MTDAPSTGKHVLVINDTEEIIELFRDIIQGMGHRVSATIFAPEDLAEVAKVEPDLANPGFDDGWRGVRMAARSKMRTSPATAKIPIIICTGATREVREQEGWQPSRSRSCSSRSLSKTWKWPSARPCGFLN